MKKIFIISMATIIIVWNILVVGANDDKYVALEARILLVTDHSVGDDHYRNILDSVSLKFDEVELDEFETKDIVRYEVLIVTSDKLDKLTYSEQATIAYNVKYSGMKVLTSGESELAKMLGIIYTSGYICANEFKDNKHPDLQINLEYEIEYKKYYSNSDFYGVFADGNQALSAFNFGNGKVIYLAAEVDFEDSEGYKTYPYLHEYIIEFFNITPWLKRDALIAYIDWGYYYDQNTNELAALIKAEGINEVHLSGWYDVNDYYVFTRRFIDACHANGILVYAWLEYPMISSEFYDTHEEFWEYSAILESNNPTWRKLVALDNPDCAKAVKEKAIEFFSEFEFDGIDFAELYYELPVDGDVITFDYESEGLTKAEEWYLTYFTPMNEYFRQKYEAIEGYDPVLLFDEESEYFFKDRKDLFYEFIDYRSDLLTELNKEFIKFFLDESNFNRKFDVVMTQIDSVFDDSIYIETGVNSEDFIKMQNELEFTFMIEDPFPLWSEGPSRYTLIGEEYGSKFSSPDKFLIDINVVNRIDTKYPNPKQTGLEITMLLENAAKASAKVCVYAENTLFKYDYKYTSYALTGNVDIYKEDGNCIFEATNDFDFIYDTNGKSVYVDGEAWPAYNDSEIILNGTKHVLEVENVESEEDFHITDINVDFKELEYFDEGIHLVCDSNQNIFVHLSKKPEKVIVDGNEYDYELYLNNSEYILYLGLDSHDIYIYEDSGVENEKNIFIGSKEYKFSQEPQIINGRTMLPLDELLDAIGANYEIHGEFEEPTVFGSLTGYVFWMQTGNKIAIANGDEIVLDTAPYLNKTINKIIAPLRFLFEALNYKVDWIESSSSVLVN